MQNLTQDIKETEWGIKTFQRCVPEKYRTPIVELVGRYYSKHPSDDTLIKIVSTLNTCDKQKYDTVEKQVKYIKGDI